MSDLSQSLEDYLEAIYIFAREKKVVRVKDLSRFLKVKTPSVVGAIKSLARNGLVRHERYGYIDLTELGRETAQQIYQKHRIISHFFHNILGVREEIAEQDACVLEHHIHPETYERMIKLFEFLEKCPEEEPTFVRNFHEFLKTGEALEGVQTGKKLQKRKLSDLAMREKGKIIRIEANEKMRKYLLALGVIRGEIIEVVSYSSPREPMEYKIKNFTIFLKKNEASFITVEVMSTALV